MLYYILGAQSCPCSMTARKMYKENTHEEKFSGTSIRGANNLRLAQRKKR